MITVLLVCAVLSGSTFVPPKDWSIDKIEVSYPGYLSNETLTLYRPNIQERQLATVHLRKTIEAGESVKAPDGCTLAVKNEGQK